MRMTKQEIIQGVENLRIMPQSNPTLSGMRIVIRALRDYADEAKKINEFGLCNRLHEIANKLSAAEQSAHQTSGGQA